MGFAIVGSRAQALGNTWDKTSQVLLSLDKPL